MEKTAETANDPTRAQAVLDALDDVLPEVDGLYQDLHRHPELSLQEQRTAGKAAERFRRAGFDVTEGVGGTGVVALLRNGDGPVVMLRADMDALPVQEQTGLDYASEVTATDNNGATVPVMHACGHDAHTSCMTGAAALLARGREHWRGTVMIIAQPAEEIFAGAPAMVRDGLYTRFPRPDVILGQHILPFPATTVAHRAGPTMAAALTLGVTVYGQGGHGSMPQATIDPVVIAAHIVTRLQTIVAREIAPAEHAVVTVGKLQAGTRGNVIADEARMEINVRSFNDRVQAHVMEAIKRIVRAEAEAGRSPREPDFEVLTETIVTDNDAVTVDRARAAHTSYFGGERVIDMPKVSGSEDFPQFGNAAVGGFEGPDIPYAYWGVGTVGSEAWEQASGETLEDKFTSLPVNHSPFFAPERESTLRTSVEAMTVGALSFLA
jgi:hippurate hydrolase